MDTQEQVEKRVCKECGALLQIACGLCLASAVCCVCKLVRALLDMKQQEK